jgi:hypothetical protein
LANGELKSHVTMPHEAFHCWINLVQQYSSCALTKPSDRLIAYSGLANFFKDKLGHAERYLAGHWKSRLAESLDWTVKEPSRRSSNFIAPSWSWASVNNTVGIRKSLSSDLLLISVLSTKIKPVGTDSAGALLDGIITVKGSIFHQAQLVSRTPILVIQVYLDATATLFYTQIIQISTSATALVERRASPGPGGQMLGNSVPYGNPDSATFSSWRARTETPNKGLRLYFPFGYIYSDSLALL